MDDKASHRSRLFYLRQSADPARQAEAACKALTGVKGVVSAEAVSTNSIQLVYSLNYLSFEIVTDLLLEIGFKLDHSIVSSLRKTLLKFLEDNARDHMHSDTSEYPHPLQGYTEIPHQKSNKYWDHYR